MLPVGSILFAREKKDDRLISVAMLFTAVLWIVRATAQEAQRRPDGVEVLKAEVRALREEHEEQRKRYEARLKGLERRLQELESSKAHPRAEGRDETSQKALEAELERLRSEQRAQMTTEAGLSFPSVGRVFQSFNPDISVVLDSSYHADSSKEGIEHILQDLDGFGHSHAHGHGHEHAHLDDGFNLRHAELFLGADVDPYFKAWAMAAVSESDAELEEAVIQTTCLPAGLQAKVGKFFSDFGRINAQHSHDWDFVDQPLVHRLLLGDHGLNEKGVQFSWLAPTPFHLLAGVEAFQGDNELVFNYVGGGHLPRREGPRLWVEWLKFAPNLAGKHGLQLGFFHARGVHQEAHDGNSDGIEDHWLDGRGELWGADAVYKYDAREPYGQGDVTLQAGYIRREKDLEVKDHLLTRGFIGRSRTDEQDGLYAQGAYGFLPRWRLGLRWDRVGLTNRNRLPDGTRNHFDETDRWSAMVDFSPTEFSRFRLQVSRGDYALGGRHKDEWQLFLQLVISLGKHGAHKF